MRRGGVSNTYSWEGLYLEVSSGEGRGRLSSVCVGRGGGVVFFERIRLQR